LAPVALAKLGGSVITDKTKPFSFREDVVSALGEEIAASRERVVIVHGGGSFGHPVAKEYGLTSGAYSRGGEGVSKTRDAMYALDQLVCRALRGAGVETYPFAPFDLLMNSNQEHSRSWLTNLLSSGLSPVTFGDVSSYPRGFKILSGDTIMLELAKVLRPVRCVFALDVDGVYRGRDERKGKPGALLRTISASQMSKLKVGLGDDATGGIKLKLEVAAKIASLGTSVSFVSGFRRAEFAKALRGLDFYGTVVE
jgi:isopentenyl phosphate kinase